MTPTFAAHSPLLLVAVIAALAACLIVAVLWALAERAAGRRSLRLARHRERLLRSGWARKCGTTVDQRTAELILAQLLRTP
jgi:hypothetical protein